MLMGARFPEFSHIEKLDRLNLFVTTDGKVGTAYRLPILDAEGPRFFEQFTALRSLVSRLAPGLLLRVIHRVTEIKSTSSQGSRADEMARLGFNSNQTLLVVEDRQYASFRLLDFVRLARGKQSLGLDQSAIRIRDGLDHGLIEEWGARQLDESELRSLFMGFSETWVSRGPALDGGDSVAGVIRIWRQGMGELNPDTWARLREQLPKPYEVSVSLQRMNDVRAQYLLQRRRAQLGSSQDALDRRLLRETEEVTAETTLSGKGLVEIEWLLVLKRSSEAVLRDDLKLAKRVLSDLGEAMIEIQGSASSLAASLSGGVRHQTFIELDELAPSYLPIFCRGEAQDCQSVPARAVPLHRCDGSLYYFDLWRKGYDGANCIINGRRGKGKSVLANFISSGLLKDPSVRLVKVDVGGSYVKECEMAGGQHVQFNLSEPSGLNPLALLDETVFLEDAAVILSGFLSTLILESKETILSKEMLGGLEKAVLSYAEGCPREPSMDDFLKHASDLPRRGLLQRFTTGGAFANALKPYPGSAQQEQGRYTYFNFERLQNAANEDFSQAVMAAVIASVNMEVLAAGDARRGDGRKVVFFADETPFFIQRNGRFFKLTTANFRKFGHATILIAQTTRDFELSKDDGVTDYGILTNSPIRFFYQVDDEPKAFAERFGLTTREVSQIQNLGRGHRYREVFLQDELGSRVLRVQITEEEYWRVSSTRADNEKLHALQQAVPGLTIEQAIRCLAQSPINEAGV